MSKYTLVQYAAMNAAQRKKINKDNIMAILDGQIGQPPMLSEDTLRNIKDTIDKSID